MYTILRDLTKGSDIMAGVLLCPWICLCRDSHPQSSESFRLSYKTSVLTEVENKINFKL